MSGLRRRTSCIYCGRDIKRERYWKDHDVRGHFTRVRDHQITAKDLACPHHDDLPGLDPDYRERL